MADLNKTIYEALQKLNVLSQEIKEADSVMSTDDFARYNSKLVELRRMSEDLYVKSGPDSLLLKWGTLKGWDYGTNEKALKLLEEYSSLGSSMSVMAQKDTDRQKEIILELIDVTNGSIQNDWDGSYYTREEAKNYIKEYGMS